MVSQRFICPWLFLGWFGLLAPALSAQVAESFVKRVEKGHGKAALAPVAAVAITFVVQPTGQPSWTGRLLSSVHSGRMMLEHHTAGTVWLEAGQGWVQATKGGPALATLLQWQYLLFAPFKFRDPGVQWVPAADTIFLGKKCQSAKFSFKPGTGLSPQDWFRVFMDPGTLRLQGMVFQPTYGQTIGKLAPPLQMVQYFFHQPTQKVWLPQRLELADWHPRLGRGNTLAKVLVHRIEMIPVGQEWFALPKQKARAK